MRVLKAQVYNPENEAFTDIELPASYEELEDTLQMINGTNESCAVNVKYFLGDVDFLQGKEVLSCSLYEMNYFATLIDKMQEHEQLQFAGLVECYDPEYPQMKEITNLALNAPTLDCYHAPATSDKDLGEFCIENELLPQLADLESLSDEQYDWVCEHLDKEKIGKEMREQEHGVFTSAGYFVKNEEIKQLYDGNPEVPKPCDYIFRLELALIPNGDEPNDQNTISLKLPAAQADIQRTLEEIGAKSMDDCCFYGYDKVQAERSRRNSKRKVSKQSTTEQSRYSGLYALNEILICGECLTPYRRLVWHRRNGSKTPVWRCISRIDHGTDYCKESPTVDEESLHQAIMDAIRATRGSRQQMIPYFIEQLRKTYQEQPTGKLDIGEVENRIEELKASTMALIQDSVLSNTVSENESRLKIMSDEIRALSDMITDYKNSQNNINIDSTINELEETLYSEPDQNDEYDDDLVRQLIDTIKVVGDDNLIFTFKCGLVYEQPIQLQVRRLKKSA